MAALDRYLRRGDTWIARSLRWASPERGEAYTSSRVKRKLDVAVGVPATIASMPVIVTLALLNRWLYPRQRSFYIQRRVGHGGATLRVVKIRSMAAPAGRNPRAAATHTSLGRFMRRTYLDELPQLAQTLRGQLSLIGIRVLPPEIHLYLEHVWSPQRYSHWSAVYGRTPLGLSGVHQVFRGEGKEDEKRFHRDLFYARRAGLGFDLYLMWRTVARMGSRLL